MTITCDTNTERQTSPRSLNVCHAESRQHTQYLAYYFRDILLYTLIRIRYRRQRRRMAKSSVNVLSEIEVKTHRYNMIEFSIISN